MQKTDHGKHTLFCTELKITILNFRLPTTKINECHKKVLRCFIAMSFLYTLSIPKFCIRLCCASQYCEYDVNKS